MDLVECIEGAVYEAHQIPAKAQKHVNQVGEFVAHDRMLGHGRVTDYHADKTFA
jgi:hypothetical protein